MVIIQFNLINKRKYTKDPIMAELKKVPMSSVKDDAVISMSFDENPNIPTSNYSEDTLDKINEVIARKMKAEKIKKIIEAELKDEKKIEGNDMGFSFSFSSM
jgi:hypothetical protein